MGFRNIARGAAGLAALTLVGFGSAAKAAASGETLYEVRCKACHDAPQGRAPSRATLRNRPKAEIFKAMSEGAMAPMTLGMAPDDMAAIADFITGAPAGAGRAAPVVTADTPCATHPPITPTASDWLGAGGRATNLRYQAHPGFTAAEAKRLKVRWAFSISHANSQPVVVGDWLWIAGSGRIYALDARTGCVHWRAEAISSRPTPSPVKTTASPSGWALIVAQRDRVVKALDAASGKPLWASEVLETHAAAGITGSPVVAGDKVIVPISSLEEGSSSSPAYPCCSFRGSVAALDLATGRTLWKSRTITEPLRPLGKNSAGTPMQGPAGAAVWSAPTVDLRRGLVYVATGDSYTDAETGGADAIQAFDLATGGLRWKRQVTPGDNWIIGCFQGGGSEANCPKNAGPDYDFGASTILFTPKGGGRQVLLAGQKSGVAYGLDPDTGRVLWKTPVGAGSALGGIEWGMAADGRRLFAPVSDLIPLMAPEMRKAGPFFPLYKLGPAKPGLSAVDPATGKVLWHVPTPKDPCAYRPPAAPVGCLAANSGAPAAMPGLVFAGSTDGFLRAYDAATGNVVWKVDTAASRYDTTNGVKGQPGGGLDGNGPTIAGRGLFVTSGWDGGSSYGDTGTGYNVLLAYTVDGK